jgi:hypothetical protein
VLRADARLAEPVAAAQPAESEPEVAAATAVVEIHAADAASLSRALSALRDSGVEVRVVQSADAARATLS